MFRVLIVFSLETFTVFEKLKRKTWICCSLFFLFLIKFNKTWNARNTRINIHISICINSMYVLFLCFNWKRCRLGLVMEVTGVRPKECYAALRKSAVLRVAAIYTHRRARPKHSYPITHRTCSTCSLSTIGFSGKFKI